MAIAMPSPPNNPQASYFPPEKGRYSTTPDFSSLGTSFGNGAMDGRLFQIDEHFGRYLAGKQGRVALTDHFEPSVAEAAIQLMAMRLTVEYPAYFALEGRTLHCALTGNQLLIDASAFDALCREVQEDIVVIRRTPERGDWNAALHVSFPSRWSPEEKLGASFAQTHLPVPGTERSRAAAPALVDTMITRWPMVRFTWGLAFSDDLDLHPSRPAPAFDGENLWLRVERQTIWPLTDAQAALFAIRVYLYSGDTIRRDPTQCDALTRALHSMSVASRAYKGIADDWDAVLGFFVPP